MKMLCVLFAMVSMLSAAGGSAPTNAAVNSAYQFEEPQAVSGVTVFGNIDTVDTDSVKVLNHYGAKTATGWEDILITKSISGADSATAIVTIIVDAYSKDDSLISSTLLDTFPTASGGAILIPFGRSAGYFGDYFHIWLKSSAEAKIKDFWHYRRRAKQISNAIW